MKAVTTRPKRVWAICIWFMFSGITGISKTYLIYTKQYPLPAGMAQPTDFLYFALSLVGAILSIAVAVLLFKRNELARWLFAAICGLGVLSYLYMDKSGSIPRENSAFVAAFTVVMTGIYIQITVYSFSLFDRGYFKKRRGQVVEQAS